MRTAGSIETRMSHSRINPAKRRPAQGRVLVAEDDPQLLLMVSAVLAHDGYDVIEVADGESVASHARNVDVIVSDVCMPRMSGLDAVADLRARGVLAPVVLMSAYPDQVDQDSARAAGAVTLLSKPFEIDDLRMIVMNLIPLRSGAQTSTKGSEHGHPWQR